MNQHAITRIISVLTGAAVLFWLEQGLGMQLHIAIPAGVLAYVITLVALGLVLKTDLRAK